MNNKEKLDYTSSLMLKYMRLPRTGWIKKGSRAKSNHAVTVSRKEIIELARDFHSAIFSIQVFSYENSNLIHFLEQLAEDEIDVQECPKCFKKYRKGWMNGKCIYCEASDAAMSMLQNRIEKE